MLICSCDDKFNGDDKAKFTWKGKHNGQYGKRDVECNVACSRCSVYIGNFEYDVLDASNYKQVYEYCDGLTKYTPPQNNQVDTTKHDPIPTGKVSFDSSSLMKYGYDSWKTCTGVSKINYLSMAEGCSTYFRIKIDGNLSTAYNRLVAVIPQAFNVSFSKGTMKDTLDLTANNNEVKIFALSGAIKKTPIDIYVYGIEDPAKPVCLAGDCYSAEDRLRVIIYEKRVFNDYLLYHHQGFSQTNDQWKVAFNNVLNQTVLEMGNQVREALSDDWDLNKNGKLDIFPGYSLYDSISPTLYDEMLPMLIEKDQINDGKCYDIVSNNVGASFVINTPIQQNWYLSEDPVPDPDGTVRRIKLGRYQDLPLMDTVRIGPFYSTANHFRITILALDTNAGKLELLIGLTDSLKQGIPDIFSVNDEVTVYNTATTQGVTIDNCSCSRSGIGWDTPIHEFLHQNIVGPLEHVTKTDNLMHSPKDTRIGNKLHYRKLKTINASVDEQEQWKDLHK